MDQGDAQGPLLIVPGMEVGPWRVLRGCGLGVYGLVFLVERVGRERAGTFAMKVARYPKDPRFRREGELLARTRHPHVPRLHDRGEWSSPDGESFPFLVMDWVEGVTLYEWATRSPRALHEKLRALAQVARALEATHAVGGVHRDVKGENVLVRQEDGAAVLIDLGPGNYLGASVLTRQPQPPGMPQYQSPESQRFEFEHAADPTARYKAWPADDVYSLGIMAHRLLLGRNPPPALKLEEAEEGLRLAAVPRALVEAWGALSPELAALLRRMLCQEPTARGSAGEVALALEGAAECARTQANGASPPRAHPEVARWAPRWLPPRARWMAMAASMLLAAIAGWGLRWRQEPGSATAAPAGGTSRLGELGSAAPEGGAKPTAEQGRIHEDVPKKPAPEQLRPPCKKPLVELQGGCWLEQREAKPPCEFPAAEWRGKCYLPIAHRQGSATSAPP